MINCTCSEIETICQSQELQCLLKVKEDVSIDISLCYIKCLINCQGGCSTCGHIYHCDLQKI